MTVTIMRAEDFPVQDNLFQTAFWGEFKASLGSQTLFFMCGYGNTPKQFPLMVMLRHITQDILYAYAPKAPPVQIQEEERGIFLEELAEALYPYLPPETICIRFDTVWRSPYKTSRSSSNPNSIVPRNEIREMRMNFGTKRRSLKKSVLDHLCPDTVLINLAPPPEEILARMRQTTRNSIRKAYRNEIYFSEKKAGYLPVWYKIYKETGIRKKFYVEELSYFTRLFSLSEKEENASPDFRSSSFNPEGMSVTAPVPKPSFHLLAAEKEGLLLSGLILAVCGKTAYYMYSGSDSDHNKYSAGYGLQWEAILAARKAGCTCYDLLGIPPSGNQEHPMSGLYTFKTGFGGAITRFCGCWDYPYDEKRYQWIRNHETMKK